MVVGPSRIAIPLDCLFDAEAAGDLPPAPRGVTPTTSGAMPRAASARSPAPSKPRSFRAWCARTAMSCTPSAHPTTPRSRPSCACCCDGARRPARCRDRKCARPRPPDRRDLPRPARAGGAHARRLVVAGPVRLLLRHRALGRLQRILRNWSQAFGSEVQPPPNGRRILLAQHADEQHSFGLAMVAEFFRRDGWEVLGGVGGAVPDPSGEVARDWFDVVGFSLGSALRVDWARERIAEVRRQSRNRSVVVLVGGPLLDVDPHWAGRLGADASGHSGGDVVALADRLITSARRPPLRGAGSATGHPPRPHRTNSTAVGTAGSPAGPDLP